MLSYNWKGKVQYFHQLENTQTIWIKYANHRIDKEITILHPGPINRGVETT